MKRKLLILGVDGLSEWSYRLLRGYGFFRSLAEVESRGILGSVETIPPLTPPMWTSIVTGVTPAKHGVYSFYVYEPGTWRPLRLYNNLDVMAPMLHDIIGYNDGRSLVVNLPLSSWPPPSIRGSIVSDWLSPRDYAKPEWLNDTLRRELEERRGWKGPCSIVARDAAIASTILRHAERLIKEHDYIFYMVQSVDGLLHRYPRQVVKPSEPCVRETLETIDEVFEKLLEPMLDDHTVIVVSDHGNEPYEYRVTLPKALLRAGLVKQTFAELEESAGSLEPLGGEESGRRGSLIARLVNAAITNPLLGPLVARVGRKLAPLLNALGLNLGSVKRPVPDPENSIAVIPRPWNYGIYINERLVANAEEAVERVVEALEKAMEETGHRFLHAIVRARESLKGPYASQAPHVILAPERGYDISGLNLYAPLIEKVRGLHANHTPYNIHMIAPSDQDPQLREAAEKVKEPWDYAVLALLSLQLPIPSYTDSTLCERAKIRCKSVNYLVKYSIARRIAARITGRKTSDTRT